MVAPSTPNPDTKAAAKHATKTKVHHGRHQHHKIKAAHSAVKPGAVVAGSAELAATNLAEKKWEDAHKGQANNGDSGQIVRQALKTNPDAKFDAAFDATLKKPATPVAQGKTVQVRGAQPTTNAFKQPILTA